MPKLPPAALLACLLTACGRSTSSMPRFEFPTPPAAALAPCTTTPVQRQPDGSASSADADATIRDRGFDIAACDAKRRALADAWPR